MGCTSLSFPACGPHDTTYSWIQGVKARHISIALYNPLMLNSWLHHGETQPAWEPVQWVAAVIPMSCEKHPGRSGCWHPLVMHPRAVCIGGLQERGGSGAEPAGAPDVLRWTLGKKGGMRHRPSLWTFTGKEKTTSASVLKDISLPALLLLSLSWVQVFPCSSSLEMRLGQTGLGGHPSIHRQSMGTSNADSPDQQRSLSTGKHWNYISFFQIRFSK